MTDTVKLEAIIASNGKLTSNFEYIQELRNQNKSSRQVGQKSDRSKKVLVLGAGLISEPIVEYFHRDKNIAITIGSVLKDESDDIANKYPGVESIYINVLIHNKYLADLVAQSDLVISLLPYELHPIVVKVCIEKKAHLVTTSYTNPEIRSLQDRAFEAGITIMTELGLDPGIDHLIAMECIHDVQNSGGKIESFVSYCGSLPAPEFSDNPLRYKFTWNPRAALLETVSAAKYLNKGKIVEIETGGKMITYTRQMNFLPGFNLEGFPNRDSTVYAKLYGISDATTVLRGTLRYAGFMENCRILQLLGLIDPKPHPSLDPQGPEITWRGLICNLLSLEVTNNLYENLKTKIIECSNSKLAVDCLENLGLLDEIGVIKMGTPVDTLLHYLTTRLALDKYERDIVILRHDVGIQWTDNRREIRSINFVVYGDVHGYTAIAKTIGYPTAIAARMILDGEIQQRGHILPFTPEIYKPMLSRLKLEGLETSETSKFLNQQL